MGVERMSDITPAKRRRGAQPGNQNAKGNQGNPRPRRNFGNRGGLGAPRGNQCARKKMRTLGAALLPEYQHNAEARAWLEAHYELLQALPAENTGLTNPLDIAKFSGLTPERIAEKGREFEFRLFTSPDFGDSVEQDNDRVLAA
jgi:hypothetical protein